MVLLLHNNLSYDSCMQFQLTCLPVNLKRSDKTDGARLRLDLEESLFQKGPGPRSKLKARGSKYSDPMGNEFIVETNEVA